MTATTPTSSQVPWRVRWVATGALILALAVWPAGLRGITLRVVHGAAQVAGVDSQEPVVISPTNPPIVNP
jgi:hypothetical protein